MAGRWSHGRKEQPSEAHPRVQHAKMECEGTWTYENGKAVFIQKREAEDTWRTPRKGYPPDAAFEEKGWKGAGKGKWKDDFYGGKRRPFGEEDHPGRYRGGKDAMDSAPRPGKGKGKSSGSKGKGQKPGRRRNDDEDEEDAFGDHRDDTSEDEVEEREQMNGKARARRHVAAHEVDDDEDRDQEEDEDAAAEDQEDEEEEQEAEEEEDAEEEAEEREEEEEEEEDWLSRFASSRFSMHKRDEQGVRLRISMSKALLHAKQAEVISYCEWLDRKLTSIRREHGSEALQKCKGDVDFSQNMLTDSMVKPILQTFSNHDMSIALLKLHKNKLTSKSIDHICDFMTRAGSQADPLMEIHLSHNSIDDTGAEHLLKTIKQLYDSQVYPVVRFHDLILRRSLVPVWVRLEQNQVRRPDKVLAQAKDAGISVCSAQNRELCGPAKCWNRSLQLVHLFSFQTQAANKKGGAKPSASSGKGQAKGKRNGASSAREYGAGATRERGPEAPGYYRPVKYRYGEEEYEEQEEEEEPEQRGGGKSLPSRRYPSQRQEDGDSRIWPRGKGGNAEKDESRWAWNASWAGWDSATSWYDDARWNYWEWDS